MATRTEQTAKEEDDDALHSIAAANPASDVGEVTAVLDTLRRLREMGLTAFGYNLRSPYGPSTTHSASEGTWATEGPNR